jgi:hydroxyacylglutathione hydrolase
MFQIISTPGHTPGSICLLDVERRQIFTGDTCCAIGVLLMLAHSCSLDTFKNIILRLKVESGRFEKNWPAHHEVPLDHRWMDNYLGCIERIYSGAPANSSRTSPVGSGLVIKCGRTAITYRSERF